MQALEACSCIQLLVEAFLASEQDMGPEQMDGMSVLAKLEVVVALLAEHFLMHLKMIIKYIKIILIETYTCVMSRDCWLLKSCCLT